VETAVERAVETKRLPTEAKAMVRHGKWSGWLTGNVGFSERAARRFMQIAS
jgi:hypothetical protein